MVEEIIKDIYRIEIPLPGNPLKSINSYVIKGDRNLIIDTGMNRRECFNILMKGLNELKINLNETDIFITHIHADHSGLANELKRESNNIFFNKPESEIINRSDYWTDILFFAMKHGFPPDELNNALQKHPGYKYSPKKKIDVTVIKEGDTISVGDYNLKCIETPGHTIGHLCLYEPEKKLLFSGDHLLIDITSNISSWSDDENLLEDYLKSLEKIKEFNIEFVLPGHRRLFKNYKERIEELKNHHKKRLDEIISILKDKKLNAFEVASLMTWDINIERWEKFPIAQKWFAHGEAIAHLLYLKNQGLVKLQEIDNRIYFSL